jgi:hypothetical protein
MSVRVLSLSRKDDLLVWIDWLSVQSVIVSGLDVLSYCIL